MTATITKSKSGQVNVGMAQIALVEPGVLARSVLGSCIGLVLYHHARHVAAFGHIVLPESAGREGPAGKFADTALPAMLELLAGERAGKPGLTAKLAGGANMFGSNGPIQIGEANRAAVKEILTKCKIPIVAEHVGGSKGRRTTFNSSTGDFTIEVAGQESIVV